jgi:hypothetical protein
LLFLLFFCRRMIRANARAAIALIIFIFTKVDVPRYTKHICYRYPNIP